MAREANLRLAELSNGMIHNDVVQVAQHFGTRQPQVPERRLMVAVLHEALECIEKHRFATNDRGRRVFREAVQWFVAGDSSWPYSFEGICAVLELDANTVRRRLRVLS